MTVPRLHNRNESSSSSIVLKLLVALARNRLFMGALLIYILLSAAFGDYGRSSASILAINHNLTFVGSSNVTIPDIPNRVKPSTSQTTMTIATREIFAEDNKNKHLGVADNVLVAPGAAATASNHNTKPRIYSRARSDRSGAAIQDMLMCHAYAFHQGKQYGGACIDWSLPQFQGKRPDRERLLKAMGLEGTLPIQCPDKSENIAMMNRQLYIQNDTMIFTREYQNYLHGLVKYPKREGTQAQIAVHIRRGDIDPCRPRTRGYPRYLPNQHFLRLIDRYNPQNKSRVVIFSESSSFESFDPFRERGYQVQLDGDIGDVWKGILMSDVIILSRSSFSLVPAILTKGKVVYTPFWHEPLPHWDVVDEAFLNETHNEFRRLKQTCPPKQKKGKK